MKRNNIILAAALFVMAITSAFATKTAFLPNPVYIKPQNQPCQELTECTSFNTGTVCSITMLYPTAICVNPLVAAYKRF